MASGWRTKSVEQSVSDSDEPGADRGDCGVAMADAQPTGRTWIRFGIWMVVGVLIYFAYGHRHAALATRHFSAKASA
jgi:hypothetical protein